MLFNRRSVKRSESTVGEVVQLMLQFSSGMEVVLLLHLEESVKAAMQAGAAGITLVTNFRKLQVLPRPTVIFPGSSYHNQKIRRIRVRHHPASYIPLKSPSEPTTPQ